MAWIECPDGIGSWELLASQDITYSPYGVWHEITLTFTPLVDIYAIALGGPCDPEVELYISYYYIDGLL